MDTTYFDKSIGAVIAKFAGFLKPDTFKTIALNTLTLLDKEKVAKILVDTSELKVIPQENQQWLDEVWFPKAKELNVRYMAFLVPSDLFGKISMEQSNKAAIKENIIKIEYFDNTIRAKIWLQQQQ